MKITYSLFKIVFLTIMLVGVLSFKNHCTYGPGRLRIKSITGNKPYLKNTISVFQYEEHGRLSTVTSYQIPDSSSGTIEKSSYQYNSQGQLIEFKKRVFLHEGSMKEYFVLFTYTYDSEGRISSFTSFHSNQGRGRQFTKTFKYDLLNRISGSAITPTLPEHNELRYKQFNDLAYTGDNVTSNMYSESHYEGTTISSGYGKIIYAFDTNVNPFYGFPIIPAPGSFSGQFYEFYSFDNLLSLSKNNLLSIKLDNENKSTNMYVSTITYAYTYNAQKMPTSRTTTINGKTDEKLTFVYESY